MGPNEGQLPLHYKDLIKISEVSSTTVSRAVGQLVQEG